MEERRKKEPDYFGEALADFAHDMASGGAIRHMVNLGYSVDEIKRRLDFPTSRERVRRTVDEYLRGCKILLEELPVAEEDLKTETLRRPSPSELTRRVRDLIDRNGEENSYVSCPYGLLFFDRKSALARAGLRYEGAAGMDREQKDRIESLLSCLTGREREYLLGIPWERKIMYHRLNGRMTEISLELALHSEVEQSFYFLKTGEKISVERQDARGRIKRK